MQNQREVETEEPPGRQRPPHPWEDVPSAQWNDWRWQLTHRLGTAEELARVVRLTPEERAGLSAPGHFRVGVTPYFASLMDPDDPHCPIRRQVIPTERELLASAGEASDSLAEDSHSPVPGLVHRYPDRVLLLAVDVCASYCRYCTRSRLVGHGQMAPSEARIEKALEYVRKTPTVRDVLLSGGDPLTLDDERLDWILAELRAISHVELIRIGTKTPAVLPQRITFRLCQVLRKYHPLWMSLHFTHPDECTPESSLACSRLADAGIPLGSQTVLLKGINDDVATMKQLVHRLVMMRVRPYYLYQCDPITGSSHFRTSVAKGLEIIEGLRGHTTGYAVPHFVIDAPGGGGKVPLQPEYYAGRDGDDILLRNYEGKVFRYPDPSP